MSSTSATATASFTPTAAARCRSARRRTGSPVTGHGNKDGQPGDAEQSNERRRVRPVGEDQDKNTALGEDRGGDRRATLDRVQERRDGHRSTPSTRGEDAKRRTGDPVRLSVRAVGGYAVASATRWSREPRGLRWPCAESR